MKKLVILMLVLGMASLANATLQISVDGNLDPVDSEIEIDVGQTLNLGVWTDSEIALGMSDNYILVVGSLGKVTGGGSALDASAPDGWSSAVNGLTADFPAVIPPAGMEGIFASVANFDFVSFLPIPSQTVLIDDVLFECLGQGDAVVMLLQAADGVVSDIVYDSVLIHQIPEPMTMALLGLGGLFLRRRK